MNDRDELGLLTGAYAVDAVTDEERAALDRALLDSMDLRTEVDSLHETALALAYAVEPVQPSVGMKSALLAKIATTPQLEPLTAAPVADTDDGLEARHTPARHVAPSAAPVVEGAAAATARRRWFTRPSAILAAAAAAVVVFVGGGIGINAYTNPQMPTSSQAASPLDQIYAASDFHRATTEVKGGGSATVVWSNRLAKSAVIFDGVKAAPAGKTYELWYIGSEASGGTITSAGLVNEVDGGTKSAVLSGRKQQGDTIGITVEPAGGSKQPTTTPIVAVSTSA